LGGEGRVCGKTWLSAKCRFTLLTVSLSHSPSSLPVMFSEASAVTSGIVRNAALKKRAWQVSTLKDEFGYHSANLANDGIRQTPMDAVTTGCAASQPATNPWWAVDLGQPVTVIKVTLTNPRSYGSFLSLSLTFDFDIQCSCSNCCPFSKIPTHHSYSEISSLA